MDIIKKTGKSGKIKLKAPFVISDLMAGDAKDILNTNILMTFVNGEKVFEKNKHTRSLKNMSGLNRIKALIFDMDGTIVSNTPYHTKAWLQFLSKYNINITEEELYPKIFGISEEIMPRFFGKELLPERNMSLCNEKELLYRDLYKDRIAELRGLKHLLQIANEKNIAVALATMSDLQNISFIVDGLGIRSSFDMIAGAEQITNGKPHPEIYELVLSTLKIEAGEAIVFEDSQGGVLSAKAAGISVIGICTTHSKEQFKAWGVDVCVSDFEEYIENYMNE